MTGQEEGGIFHIEGCRELKEDGEREREKEEGRKEQEGGESN